MERTARCGDLCGCLCGGERRKKLQVVGRHLLKHPSKSNQQVNRGGLAETFGTARNGNEIEFAMREVRCNQQRIGGRSATNRVQGRTEAMPRDARDWRRTTFAFLAGCGGGLTP